MKKVLLFTIGLLSILSASDAVPVLLFPEDAQNGFFTKIEMRSSNYAEFTYSPWYYDTDYSSAKLQSGKMIYGFKGLVSSSIEIRGDQPSDEPIGTTQYSNTCLYVGRKWDLGEKFYLDTKIKLLTESLFYATSWGTAADLRMNWTNNINYTVFSGLSNVGYMSELNEESTPLPSRFYAGGNILFNAFEVSLLGGMDFDAEAYIQYGIKYSHPIFDVTYSYDSLKRINHLGADIKWNKIIVGYGLYLAQDGLGNISMMSVGLNL